MKKSAQTICLCLLTIAFNSFVVVGQFKVPKIFKPKTNQPTQTTTPPMQTPSQENESQQNQNQQNQSSQSNRRQSSGERLWTASGDYVDDGFTWFGTVEASEKGANGLSVPTGWTLKPSVRLPGVYPIRSVFKFVVSRAGKEIGTLRCEARVYNIPRNENPQEVSYVYTDGCWNKTQMATKETGKLDVEVFLIDGLTSAERSVRKYKIDVVQIDRVNGAIGKAAKPADPRYVVLRHSETPVSVLYLRPAGGNDYFHLNDTASQSNQVEIYFSMSPTKAGWGGFPNAALRCSVGGRRVKLRDQGSQTDIVTSNTDQGRQSYEIYSDRLAAPYSAGGPVYEDDFGFRIYRAALPLTYGTAKASPNRTNLKEYPGNWECSISDNGTVLRTWRWIIGADGMPVKHPEQNGGVNLFSNAYIAETEVPAGGTVYDKHLAPIPATEGFFYGQKWTSAEGKAAAARVPTKGRLLPVPSNKIK